MAYGSIIGQPGYTAPPKSMMGPKKPGGYGGGYTPPKIGGRASLGGGPGALDPGIGPRMGFPTYKKPASTAGPAQVTAPSAQPTNANLKFPKAQPYNSNVELDANLPYLANYGKGLMDPNSELYRRISAGMQQQIGAQTAAQQRAARLRQAWGGGGAGNTGELMMTTADLGQAGLEAQGQAEANLRMMAPQMGAGMMQSTFQPYLGYAQLQEGSRQFGAGLGEQSRQFGANMGLQQQQMANQNALAQAGMQMQANQFNAQAQNQWNLQQQALQHQLLLQQMAGNYA